MKEILQLGHKQAEVGNVLSMHFDRYSHRAAKAFDKLLIMFLKKLPNVEKKFAVVVISWLYLQLLDYRNKTRLFCQVIKVVKVICE